MGIVEKSLEQKRQELNAYNRSRKDALYDPNWSKDLSPPEMTNLLIKEKKKDGNPKSKV